MTRGYDKDESEILRSLEAIRGEGNRLFGNGDWIGAVARYAECIEAAICTAVFKGKNLEIRSEKVQNVMKLSYSNRAEALLRLRDFEGALVDAENALDMDPIHSKSLFRQGRAAMELGFYEKSCQAFEAALEQRPDDSSIIENFMSSMVYLEQSVNHGITSLHLSESTKTYAGYVGPVEIRHVSYGYGRRGLFANQAVKADSILLVSNPMAVATDGASTDDQFIDIIKQFVEQASTSKRSMAQIHSLASAGDGALNVPSMKLFEPGSEWFPPGASTLEPDFHFIAEIAGPNLYRKISSSSRNGEDSLSTALYLLPAFLNHSCAPNCIPESIGNAKFIRALRDIRRDEELTIRYYGNLFTGLGDYQDRAKTLRFKCGCERCVLEKQLNFKTVFLQINAQVRVLVPASKGEFAYGCGQSLAMKEIDGVADQGETMVRLRNMKVSNIARHQEGLADCRARGSYPATRELAALVDHVEALIGSMELKITAHQQGWIRSCFLEIYLAKYQLEIIRESDTDCKIDTLKVIVDSMISVGTPGATLTIAHLLLHEVKKRYNKETKIFKSTKALVWRVIQTHSRDEWGVRVWSGFNSTRPKFDYSTYCINGAQENFL